MTTLRYFEDIHNAEHWNHSLKKPSVHELQTDNSILKHNKEIHVNNGRPVRNTFNVLEFDKTRFIGESVINGSVPDKKVNEQFASYLQPEHGLLPSSHVTKPFFEKVKPLHNDRPGTKKMRNTSSNVWVLISVGLVISLIASIITYKYLITSENNETVLSSSMSNDEPVLPDDEGPSDSAESDNPDLFNEIPAAGADTAGIPSEDDSAAQAEITADTGMDVDGVQQALREDSVPMLNTEAKNTPSRETETQAGENSLQSEVTKEDKMQPAPSYEEDTYLDAGQIADPAETSASGQSATDSMKINTELPVFSPLSDASGKVKELSSRLEAEYNAGIKDPGLAEKINKPAAQELPNDGDSSITKSTVSGQGLTNQEQNKFPSKGAVLLVKNNSSEVAISSSSDTTVSASIDQPVSTAVTENRNQSRLVPDMGYKVIKGAESSQNLLSSSLKEMFVSYEEDFNEHTIEWPLLNDARFLTNNSNGEYYIEHKSEGMDAVIYSRDIPQEMDFIINVYISSFQGRDSNYYGLLFGAQDSSNGYLFIIRNNHSYSIRKLSEGISEELAEGPIDNIFISGSDHKSLKAVKQRSVISFYINDLYIDEVSDATFPGEKIGFALEGKSKISVDWVKTEIRFKSQYSSK